MGVFQMCKLWFRDRCRFKRSKKYS